MIVEFVPEEDRYVNAMGVKASVVAMVGVAAAVANAIYHRHGQAYPRFANYNKLL